jgi:hypothetical protein
VSIIARLKSTPHPCEWVWRARADRTRIDAEQEIAQA